ncbi:MAG TPA: NlpC/P60 family protein [Clostridia bacterium]|nr:NlpC/P60 family protein [Clostridia bacterium]
MSGPRKFLITAVSLILFLFLSSQMVFASSAVTLKKDMRGDAVTELQKALQKLGYMDIDPTGYYGDITEAAVKAFQKKYGLERDGIAGRKTVGKIETLTAGKARISSKSAAPVKTFASRGVVSSTVDKLISFAKRFVGVRYRWGGTTPKGFDCSGFTRYVFKNIGIALNRTSTSQAAQGEHVSKSNLQPGDLVFFDTNGGNNHINHVGIYIGGGKFIQASSTGTGVTVSDIESGFYDSAYMTARRVM